MVTDGLGAKLYSRWNKYHTPPGRVTNWKPTFMERMPYSGNALLDMSSKCARPSQKSVIVSGAASASSSVVLAATSLSAGEHHTAGPAGAELQELP